MLRKYSILQDKVVFGLKSHVPKLDRRGLVFLQEEITYVFDQRNKLSTDSSNKNQMFRFQSDRRQGKNKLKLLKRRLTPL